MKKMRENVFVEKNRGKGQVKESLSFSPLNSPFLPPPAAAAAERDGLSSVM